jgi:hypothetical protein
MGPCYPNLDSAYPSALPGAGIWRGHPGYRLSLCARTERRFESALFHAKQNYSSNRRRSLNTSRCAIVARIERVKIPLRSWIRAMVFAMVPSRLGSAIGILKAGGGPGPLPWRFD